jgi:hypothetical protein
MSALGQKQTCALQYGMSRFTPESDIECVFSNVRFGPKADIVHSHELLQPSHRSAEPEAPFLRQLHKPPP